MVPRAVLMKSGLVSVNTARQVNTAHSKITVNAARPMSYLSKTAHSTVKRPIDKNTSFKNSNTNQRVNTVRDKKINTARPKAVVNAVKRNNFNAVKASACWVWKPKTKVLDHGNPQMDLQDQGVIDSGCSRHMTGNMSYLTDYEEIDGGYVAFGGNPKGGKITGKGTIKTGNLDFENVYFVRELKFNLFSVSQMCDKKNSVLFNDTECIVLSPNFKLIDESQVLLRVPRKNNMYSVDLKNIVPKGGLTCLFAKATSDESKLWHRRLGHLNFKTMNKLVKGNLVRGLPSKLFKNDQTCVACQKGKQHRAFLDHKVKVIRCDNGIEFKNREIIQFCKKKGILRQFSVARTPQQNGVVERRNKTLIEAARTMLADSKLPTTFWAKVVNTACYVQNRVLVVKPHNKTPYELFHGRTPNLSFMRLFGCPVTILNTIDHLGKFDGKADEGFFVGYSLNSKAFRVFNSRTKIVEKNLHIRFSKSTPNVIGSGSDWLFDIDALTRTMNYEPIVADPKSSHDDDGSIPSSDGEKKVDEDTKKESECNDQEKEDNVNSTNNVNAAGINEVNVVGGKTSIELPFDPKMPALEDYNIFDFSNDDKDVGAEANMNNLDTTIQVSPIPTTRIHKDHPLDQVIGDLQLATQTRKKSKNLEEHGFVSTIQQRTNHKDLQNCLFACFLSQEEPKKVIHALKDPSWIEAMQEELLQFKLQEVWTLVDLPNRKTAIGSKCVFRNKKDEKGIVIRNKARLVTQGYTQEEGIDYDEVFAPIVRIEAIRLFLAYASFKGFVVYQMDVKNAFRYGKIKEEVYICQPPGFEDLEFPDRVYKVEKALYGLHQAPRAWHKGGILLVQVYVDDIIFGSTKKEPCLAFEKLMHEKFQMGSMGEHTFFLGLQVKQKKDGIFISQDKYVDEILKKFGSMIGSLMYLTSSRTDIMFEVCACARYQVNLKVSHLHDVKRIFSARNRQWLQIPQQKLNMWLLQVAMDKCFGFRINYLITVLLVILNTAEFLLLAKAKKSVRLMMEKLFGMELELILAKTINGDVQLHALVDGKKIIVTESFVRRDLQLADEEGIDCLPNFTIFEELTRMGPKTTAWNEFSSTMVSVIIYLSTNQKFNFSKYNFESMVRNLDNLSGKFLMCPRNMRRVVKGFSGKVTPLFPTMVVQNQSKLGEGSASHCSSNHTTIIQLPTQPQKTQKPRKPKRKDTQVPQPSNPSEHVADEAIHKELGDSLVRTATTASSLEAEQDSGNITKTRSKIIANKSSSLGTTSSGGPRCQETMGDTTARTRFESVSKHSNDSLLARSNTLRSDKDRLKLNELIELYEDITLVNVQDGADNEMFDVNALNSEEINDDHQLAERMQAQEQEEVSDAEKTTLFQQLLEKRRKHFAAKRAKERRNKPPTKAQQRQIMCTYLKEHGRIQDQDLNSKGESVQESSKKQKVDDDKETAKLKQCLEIIPDEEEVTIDVIPLAVKSPSIVGWKIHKEGRKSYYQIMRADGKSQMYMIFSHMLKSFSREDLEDLYKLVKAKYKSTRPVEDLDLMQHVHIHMLVEKKYPLIPSTLTMMLEKKLQIDYESEMAFQLLKSIVKQLKK
ncbi:putative ribonuclease H-like domain-containing protein [Tanacetum coccineum]